MRPARRLALRAAAILAAGALTAAGCVEERSYTRTANRGVPLRTGAPAAPAASSGGATRAGGMPVALPEGPIASPAAPGGTMVSEVRIALTPLGVVPFDGQVLPIISPDGRFLATQTGEAPTWAHLLAAPNAGDPPRTTVEVFELTDKGPARVEAAALPEGVMLGRGADDRGVFIEQPLPGGDRRAGRLPWANPGSDAVEWLATDGPCAAHAVPLADGQAAWAQRAAGDSPWRLRTSTSPNAAALPDSCRALFPIPSPSPELLFAAAATGRGVEILALRLPRSGARPFTISAAMLGESLGEEAAYQAASVVQPLVGRAGQGGSNAGADRPAAPADLLFFHPGAKRMAIFSPSSGRLTMLAPRSMAGAWMTDAAAAAGVFLTTDKGLIHQRLTLESNGSWRASSPVRVLDEPFVPRETRNPDRPWILIGPVRADPARLQILAMRLARDGE